MTRVVIMEANEAGTHEVERLRPKVGRIPANLRLLNEHDAIEEDHSTTTRKSDTHFMFLLVGLFIIVNLVLVTLLNHREKNVSTQSPTVAHSEPAKPVVPVAPVVAPVLPTPVKPVTNVQPPAVVAKPVLSPAPPAPVTPQAYVTPVSSATTKTVAAPVQHVTISEAVPQATVATVKPQDNKSQDNLVVVHTPMPADSALPAITPAAGTQAAPVATSPAAATQDLLSVINKD